MNKLIFTALIFTTSALAADNCSNYAKYAAIRAYKSEVGTIQGSDGISYSARLIAQAGRVFEYEVTISDNNEDGETWDVQYQVQVKERGTSCKVISVTGPDL